ncbi:hypothetical protein BJX96DRAFT_178451 [Aspergillus floccosus]
MSNALKNTKAYQDYLTYVPSGTFSLPPYEKDDDGDIILHSLEVFCRAPDCPAGQVHPILFSKQPPEASESHKDISLKKDKGGRDSADGEAAALRFYKALRAYRPDSKQPSKSEKSKRDKSKPTKSKPTKAKDATSEYNNLDVISKTSC